MSSSSVVASDLLPLVIERLRNSPRFPVGWVEAHARAHRDAVLLDIEAALAPVADEVHVLFVQAPGGGAWAWPHEAVYHLASAAQQEAADLRLQGYQVQDEIVPTTGAKEAARATVGSSSR